MSRSATTCWDRAVDTAAEYAVLTTWARKPASVDWSVAAGAALVGETAERGLRLLGVKAVTRSSSTAARVASGPWPVQLAVARGATVIASAGQDNHDYLREIGATPVLYGEGLVNRVRAVPVEHIDAVFDTVGKTPIEDLIALAPEPSQVVTIANFGAGASRGPGHRRRGRQPRQRGVG